MPQDHRRSDIGEFEDPFVGHLPSYLRESEKTAPGKPDQASYDEALMSQWSALLDSPESKKEGLVHAFLERHPSLLPGPYSVDGVSGHSPFPRAVISKPKLPGMSDRVPDFMWISTDSASVSPILIEIESPRKKLFHGEQHIHSDFTQAHGQLLEWKVWFSKPANQVNFLEYFDVPADMARRTLRPRYVLIYGRRAEFKKDLVRMEKRAQLLQDGDERLMTFDRLSPCKNSVLLSCVKRRGRRYRSVAVPPSFTLVNQGSYYQPVTGWAESLDDCLDMAVSRREYLKGQLDLLTEDPDVYCVNKNGLHVRKPTFL